MRASSQSAVRTVGSSTCLIIGFVLAVAVQLQFSCRSVQLQLQFSCSSVAVAVQLQFSSVAVTVQFQLQFSCSCSSVAVAVQLQFSSVAVTVQFQLQFSFSCSVSQSSLISSTLCTLSYGIIINIRPREWTGFQWSARGCALTYGGVLHKCDTSHA
jgi:hypothetical protein